MDYSLRKPQQTDLAFFDCLGQDPDVKATSLFPPEFEQACVEAWVAGDDDSLSMMGHLRRVVVDGEGRSVGHVDLAEYDPVNLRAAVGIAIDRRHRRCGAALAALRLIEAEARRAMLEQIYALVAVDNEASLRLFRRAGWREVGTLKEWLNVGGVMTDCVLFQRLV